MAFCGHGLTEQIQDVIVIATTASRFDPAPGEAGWPAYVTSLLDDDRERPYPVYGIDPVSSEPACDGAAFRRAGQKPCLVPAGGGETGRATGITTYQENVGTLEDAQATAAHESPRTTSLYDRRGDEISLNEVERIVIWPAFSKICWINPS